MKTALALMVLLTSCVNPLPATTNPASESEEITNRFQSVAALVSPDARHRTYCSGVFVDQYVLTAAHCVTQDDGTVVEEVTVGTYAYHIQEPGQEPNFSRTFVFWPRRVWTLEDIALLEPSETLPRGACRSTVVATLPVELGETVRPFGNPLGFHFFFSVGQVVDPLRTDIRGMEYTLINAVIYPGMSGGPVFNRYGELVGLNSWAWTSGAWNMIGIVPQHVIVRMLVSQEAGRRTDNTRLTVNAS